MTSNSSPIVPSTTVPLPTPLPSGCQSQKIKRTQWRTIVAKEPYGEPPSGEAPKPYYEVVAKESSGEPGKRIQWRTPQIKFEPEAFEILN